MYSKLFLLLTILVISCGVKQPLDVNAFVDNGSIVVTSTPPGAQIFLNGQHQSGKVTPDTLQNISTGVYIVKVFKEGFTVIPDSIVVTVKKDSLHLANFTLDEIDSLATIIVNSTPNGAAIWLDGQPTGRVTPDTVRIAAGMHTIRAVRNGFKPGEWQIDGVVNTVDSVQATLEIEQCVLLEAFGNVSCVPCVTSAENLEAFRANFSGPSYALLEYYANWPATKDPFYLEAPKDVDERVQKVYKIISLPALRANGLNKVDATEYDQIVTAYQTGLAAHNTPLAISIAHSKEDTTLNVEVELFDFNNLLSNTDLRLFIAVTEDDITIDPAPGTNGLTHFNFVFRGFMTAKTGDPIESNKMTYQMRWPAWNYANAHIIAFIQNSVTNEVVQTTIN